MQTARNLAKHLSQWAPLFTATPEQVLFLTSPRQYHEFIKDHITSSKKRISMASLYFGTDEMEKGVVDALKSKLVTTEKDPNFKLHIHMDYLRGTRGHPNSPASLVLPLLGPRTLLSFYLTPLLEGKSWRKLLFPPRWNEIFGLSHLKVCVFDDTVLISGANFSTSYFSDRADRYVCIKNHSKLAEYFFGLLNTISSFSHTLKGMKDNQLIMDSPNLPSSEANGAIHNFVLRHHENDWSNPSHSGTFIIPTLQMAPLHIRQDEKILEALMQWTNENLPNSSVSLTTGYFNLSPLIQHIISQAKSIKSPWKILTSSPRANGFFESAGMSRHIPNSYRAIELAFLQSKDRPTLENDSIYEYSRDGWTFHAKGLWIDNDPLMATVLGSSNFGCRSFERDLEAQVTIITDDKLLVESIRSERDELFKYSSPVNIKDITKDGNLSLPLRTAAFLLKSYL